MAGLRPGFGRGGIIHSFFVKIEVVCCKASRGAIGLLIEEGASGASACGEAADVGDDEADMTSLSSVFLPFHG